MKVRSHPTSARGRIRLMSLDYLFHYCIINISSILVYQRPIPLKHGKMKRNNRLLYSSDWVPLKNTAVKIWFGTIFWLELVGWLCYYQVAISNGLLKLQYPGNSEFSINHLLTANTRHHPALFCFVEVFKESAPGTILRFSEALAREVAHHDHWE